jgi:catechol 2,3-dioxygenase
VSDHQAIAPETRIGLVSLTVNDVERLRDFYGGVLGMQSGPPAVGADWVGRANGTPLVQLVADPQAPRRPPRTTGLYHFAILLPERTDLARMLDRLVRAGYPLQGAADHQVSEAIYLADPEGNGIEIYRDRPPAQWRDAAGQVSMPTEPLDLESLLASVDRAAASAPLPPGARVGHLHVVVSDLERAERFYCDVLGFQAIARYGNVALFVAAGGYHHHIGLNVFGGTGWPAPPPGARGLRQFQIVLPDRDELERLRARLAEAGSETTVSGDSLHVRDPFGIGVELAVVPPAA